MQAYEPASALAGEHPARLVDVDHD